MASRMATRLDNVAWEICPVCRCDPCRNNQIGSSGGACAISPGACELGVSLRERRLESQHLPSQQAPVRAAWALSSRSRFAGPRRTRAKQSLVFAMRGVLVMPGVGRGEGGVCVCGSGGGEICRNGKYDNMLNIKRNIPKSNSKYFETMHKIT